MTRTNRIILNTIASYGRSIFGVLCALFSTRWVLMALGHEDFGLYGLIGSLVIFVTFFNIQFSVSLGRFYAVSIGRANASENKERAIEDCRDWFSTGLIIHLILPVVLVGIGYPAGCYVINNGILNIPSAKVDVCVWLWRFAMISCFIAMMNVPFNAMFTAKQCIVEPTVYSIGQVIVRLLFVYYMTMVQKEWLFYYGLAMCVIVIVPHIIICLRAICIFPECRFRLHACKSMAKFKEIAAFSWWQTFGGLGYLARHQCLEIVINKFHSAKENAAYTLGMNVANEAAALTSAMNVAFGPAITTAYGEGNIELMKRMCYRACKFGAILTLFFAVPAILEIDFLLKLWLKTPPAYTSGFCLIWLLVVIFEKFTLGHGHAVQAVGKIRKFQVYRGLVCFVAIPLAILLTWLWRTPYMVGASLLTTVVLMGISDVYVARKEAGLGIRYWLSKIVSPIFVVGVISFLVGLVPITTISPGFMRLVLTTLTSLAVLVILAWKLVLDKYEREYLLVRCKVNWSRISHLINR